MSERDNTSSIRTALLLPLFMILLVSVSSGQQPVTQPSVNVAALVSRADITYTTPAHRSEEGLPIGNGVMGSLVWTTPSALKFQVNRVDVFSSNASSVSFPSADSDYGSSCGYVDINAVSAGQDVFSGESFRQHLSVYDGRVSVRGKGVKANVFALHGADVIVVQIDDQRTQPEPINIDMRMLRYMVQTHYDESYALATSNAVKVKTAEHVATSQLHVVKGRILLTQKFEERGYYNASGLAIHVLGRPSRARFLNESTVQLSASARKGKMTILISSAASFDRNENIMDKALAQLDFVADKNFDALASQNRLWWDEFWGKGYVHLTSKDGQADFVEQNYTYFLYLMGSTSLGPYPPRFGGLLFNTNGDMRRWGSQYWWANTQAYYRNIMPANRMELIEPMFDMYSDMVPSCEIAARQQWGSKGMWIPEIVNHDGLEKLPEDIAAELQDLVLARKKYEERSPKFQWFIETKNRHHARWNFQADGSWDHGHFVVPTKASFQPGRFSSPEAVTGIFGHCTHILGAGGRIANLYWQRFQYTQDMDWLKDRAYPMIKGSAEFYRNFPNLQKLDDGKYHILHVNNGEGNWNAPDSPYEIGVMHMIFPLAVRASEVLGVDAELRPLWKEIKDNLITLPERPRRSGASRGGYGAFVYGGPGEIEPMGTEPELKSMFLNFNRTGGFIDSTGIGGAMIFRNRLRLREGPGAIDAEHIGGLASGIHSSLLESSPDSPDDTTAIRVFPQWPKDWNASFSLLARGGFLISSSGNGARVKFVTIASQLGSQLRMVNPWGSEEADVYRNGHKVASVRGSWIAFPTEKGETITIVPAGVQPSTLKDRVPQ